MTIKSIYFFILFLSFQIFSCANNFYIKRDNIREDYRGQINYLGEDNSALVTLINDNQIQVKNIEFSNENVIFIEIDSTTHSDLKIDQIKMISFTDRFVGLAYGAVYGFGFGTLIGFAGAAGPNN